MKKEIFVATINNSDIDALDVGVYLSKKEAQEDLWKDYKGLRTSFEDDLDEDAPYSKKEFLQALDDMLSSNDPFVAAPCIQCCSFHINFQLNKFEIDM